ncbi:MAG TPA: hypothetical protein VNU97_04480 [Rhizomicrobium sp.]|nr:hypothetical protein [Rhizomicrobium sp.]
MNTLVLGLLIVVAPAVLAGLCVLLARRFLHETVREGHNDVLVPLFLTAGTIYAVMLGFLVVVVWEAYGDAKDNVAVEASTLTTMYRQTNGMNPEELKAMREHIRAYTEAVVGKEWAIQARTGGAAPEARRQIAEIYREYARMPADVSNSSINREFLNQFSLVTAARNKRTLQASEEVPWVLWFGLIGGATIVVAMSCILYMDTWWPHMLMSGVLTLMIGMLLFITVILAKPFVGALALEAGPFEHSLSVYKAVDGGN